MIKLDLTEPETEILSDALESYLSDLRMEIADTDLMEYRQGLKTRKAVLMKVVESIKESVSA